MNIILRQLYCFFINTIEMFIGDCETEIVLFLTAHLNLCCGKNKKLPKRNYKTSLKLLLLCLISTNIAV